MKLTDPVLECLSLWKEKGFTTEFQIKSAGLFALNNSHRYYEATEIKIVEHFRFEGDSDPDNSAIIYVVETADGLKGTVIDAFGIYADSFLSDFMKKVKELSS